MSEFSQEQLNEIVQERVAREKAKYADLNARYEALLTEKEQAETQLKELTTQVEELPKLKRQQLLNEVATEAGVPTEFLNRLVGETKDELKADAVAFMSSLGQTGKTIPKSPDGGGEAPKKGMALITEHMRSK